MNNPTVIRRIFNKLFKLLYWPICRAYARFLGDKPADAALRFLSSWQFRRVNGFWPDFLHPTSFSEKLWSRMLHERDPLFTLISDKLLVRNYVVEKIGRDYLIPLLWFGGNPEDIPFDSLPLKYVIKTNHGCGYNILVNDKRDLDRTKTKRQLEKWLGENYCLDYYLGIEWGYKNIKPSIIIEPFLGREKKAPIDYKFYCFSGAVEVLTLHFDRFEGHNTKAFDKDFEPLRLRNDFDQYRGIYKHPQNFSEMVKLAEALAAGFDFIRVDLYNLDEKIYFGELTPYPAGVSSFLGLDLKSQDHILGERWKWGK